MSLHGLMILSLLPFAAPAPRACAQEATSTPIEYRFDDDMVQGSQKSSSGEVLYVRARKQRESLVRAREHWLPELFHSVEQL